MIVIAVVVVLGVVVVAASWARVASARAERRSVEGYGRVLDTLGDVSKRSEAGTTARSSSASELARPHVRPANGEANQAFRPASAPRDVPAPRVRLQPPVPGAPMPVFGDEAGEAASGQPAPRRSSAIGPVVSDRPEEPLTVAIPVVDPTQPVPTGAPRDAGGPSPGPLPPPAGPVYGPPLPGEALAPAGEALAPAGEAERPDDAGEAASPGLVFDAEAGLGGGEADGAPGERSQRVRRAATGAAAAVALGALAVGGYQLAADNSHASTSSTGSPVVAGTSPARRPPATTARAGAKGAGGGTGAAKHPATTAPAAATSLQPVSQTGSVVAYAAPAKHYTITFSVTGASDCWLGAQATPGGSYLWMQTVAPGATTTYSASGPVVIRLGAPKVVSVSVNGLKVVLPPGNVQPYDISFTPSSSGSTSAA